MSADNGYILTKHPKGGFCFVMYFASDDNPDLTPAEDAERFETLEAALKDYADGQTTDGADQDWVYPKYWSEYGLSIDNTIFETPTAESKGSS